MKINESELRLIIRETLLKEGAFSSGCAIMFSTNYKAIKAKMVENFFDATLPDVVHNALKEPLGGIVRYLDDNIPQGHGGVILIDGDGYATKVDFGRYEDGVGKCLKGQGGTVNYILSNIFQFNPVPVAVPGAIKIRKLGSVGKPSKNQLGLSSITTKKAEQIGRKFVKGFSECAVIPGVDVAAALEYTESFGGCHMYNLFPALSASAVLGDMTSYTDAIGILRKFLPKVATQEILELFDSADNCGSFSFKLVSAGLGVLDMKRTEIARHSFSSPQAMVKIAKGLF